MKLIKLGTEYGGHTIPDNLLNKDSIVYSGGAGEDISFDLKIFDMYECHVHIFDPTPRSIKYSEKIIRENELEDYISFYPYGISDKDCQEQFWGPANPKAVSHSCIHGLKVASGFVAECKSIPSIMKDLKHNHIDLLKLDIEGAEFKVINNIIENNIFYTMHNAGISQSKRSYRFNK